MKMLFLSTVWFLFMACAMPSEYQMKTFTFPVDNNCPQCFGYKTYEHDMSVGPASIIIHENFAYVTDRVHGNVKRIDLETGELAAGPRVNNSYNPWLNDIAIFNGKIYVTSDLDSVHVLDMNLKPLYAFYLGRGEKYFTRIQDENFEILIELEDRKVVIDKSDAIVSAIDKVINLDIIIQPHGKKYEIIKKGDKQFIKNQYDLVALQTPYSYNFNDYDAFRIDFTENRLVYFDVNDSTFTLYVYNKIRK